jgi:[FeFe] hydrogenase H-cluster maturation GTPase HydF
MNETPSGERLHIAVFGRRNAGKSSLVNALAGQPLAIVSPVAGTTTDPVAKAMELLPLGPVVLTDTAGIDDEGELGRLRVSRTLRLLEHTDVALLVVVAGEAPGPWEEELAARARARQIPLVVVASQIDRGGDARAAAGFADAHGCPLVPASATTGAGIDDVRRALIAAAPVSLVEPSIVGDLVSPGDVAVLVVPIDQAAPKGRLILPQVMTLRDLLDHDAVGLVVKERELATALAGLARPPRLVVTDSQAFQKVAADVPRGVPLTGFSILMARYRGSLDDFVAGARFLRSLRPDARVLIAEGCTHHRQADDIGTVQIPRWLRQLHGGGLQFAHATGVGFPDDLGSYDLVIHCGACTLNRREMLHRQREARAAGVPMTNYGLTLAWVHGVLDRALEPFPAARLAWVEGEKKRPRVKVERTTE